jgi:uncharacterized delta-60 repeat protein
MKKTCIHISAMPRVSVVIAALAMTLLSIITPTCADAAGSHLDYSFANAGRINFSFGNSSTDEAHAIAVQPDGKIVVVGRTDVNGNSDFAIARLTPSGALDTTFDGDGLLTIDFGAQTIDEAFGVLIQPDGKIVVVGETRASGAAGNFAIVRLTSLGLPDETFDGDGRGVYDFGSTNSTYDSAEAVTIQPDGKIILAGATSSGGTDWALLRLTTGGIPDFSFGNNGRVTTDFNGDVDEARSVIVLPDNRIVAVGMVNTSTGLDFGMVRYTEQGVPDSSLNGNGKFLIDVSNQSQDDAQVVRRTSDGKLLIGGTSDVDRGQAIAMVKCSIDGVLDSTFGTGGKVLTIFNPSGTNNMSDMAINGSGEIAVAGFVGSYTNGGFTVAKYLSNGQLDSRFGSGGRVGTVFDVGLRTAAGVAFQPDGKIVAVGTVRDYNDFGVARYKPQGIAAAGDYDGDGRAEIGVYRGSEGMWYLQNLVTGAKTYVRFGLAGDQPVPGDYDGDGKTDVAVYRPSNGTWYVNRSSDGQLIVMPFGLSNDTPLPGDYDGDGKTDLAVYRLATGTWYLLQSSRGLQTIKYGSDIAFPFPGDYDGDGQTDICVYRPADKTWWIRASTVPVNVTQFGSNGDLPVPADYDGDGVTDLGMFRSDGNWWIRRSETATSRADHWGIGSDITAPADFDGDGRADLSVFRSSTGVWYINRADGTVQIVEWGIAGDIPLVGITFRAFA